MGKSPAMRELRERAREMAAHPAPVLIVGEPGSGREALARFIHNAFEHDQKPFVRLVAASVPAENVAIELLGKETADGTQAGYLERAAGGILFIDELQNLCAEGQALLLGVLERGSFARLGQANPQRLDCRLLVSVSPEVLADPAAHGLRADLLTCVSVLTLRVPPLREYPEDISEILRQFVEQLVESEGLPYRHFGVAAQNRLRNYPWPGNVAELSRLVRRMLLSPGSEEISLQELETALDSAPHGGSEPLVKQDLLSMPLREAREQFERAYLTQQLKLCDGKVGQLAKRVGMERTHLYRKLRSLGVDFRQLGED
jgi:DNA-binding NtrC family response regulator